MEFCSDLYLHPALPIQSLVMDALFSISISLSFLILYMNEMMQLAIPTFLKLESFRCPSYVNTFQFLHIFFSFSDGSCNSFFSVTEVLFTMSQSFTPEP